MMRSEFIFMVLLFTLLSISAIAEETAQFGEAPVAADTVSAGPAADLVVVRVSGDPITEKQVLSAINELAKQENLSLEQSQQRNSLLFDRAVDSLVAVSLMRMHMREMEIVVSETDVENQLRQMAQRFPTPEAFQKALTDQGQTEAGLRNTIRETIRMQRVVNEASNGAEPLTEADLEKFYAENPDRFNLPERARLAHILLQIPPNATTAQKVEIRKQLEGIRVEIAAEIITFEDAAAKYSQDANTAGKGGEMGLASRGNLPKSFADAVFSAKPGTVTPSIESQSGYHILKIIELLPAGQSTLEEAKPALRQALEQNAIQSARRKFVEELKSKASIEYFMTSEEFAKRRQ